MAARRLSSRLSVTSRLLLKTSGFDYTHQLAVAWCSHPRRWLLVVAFKFVEAVLAGADDGQQILRGAQNLVEARVHLFVVRCDLRVDLLQVCVQRFVGL